MVSQGPLYTQSWTVQSYVSAGNQIAAIAQPRIAWATSYTAIAGGSPSATGTSIGVAESVDGLPVFGLKFWGPSCQWQAGGGSKVPLGGTALTRYDNEKQQLLTGNYLTSSSCSAFFNADPARASYFSLLPSSVAQQVPYDGLQSNISFYDAGFLSATDLNDPIKVSIFKGAPVCGQFVAYRGRYGTQSPKGKVTAASQLKPPAGGSATDVYINTNTKVLTTLVQATVLHEALHNLTGRYDDGLFTLLGLRERENCAGGSVCITKKLSDEGCAGTN